MQTEPPALTPNERTVTIPVKYRFFVGNVNLDLTGSGTFSTVVGSGVFRFTGRKRGLFTGQPKEMIFGAKDITDVLVDKRMVQFSTPRGESGRRAKPFVFYCASETDATELAVLLPSQPSTDTTATREFHAALERMPGKLPGIASITALLVAANVVVFVIMAGLLDVGWINVTDLRPYILYGANNGAATTNGEWWRLVSSMFLHYGILHLSLNMWALLQAGQLLERLQGWKLYLLTYLASGIGGSLLSIAWSGDKTWSAGASGAVFGVYGAILGHVLRQKRSIPKVIFKPLFNSTLLFLAYNLLFGLAHRGIDNAAHIGGFVTGVLFGWLAAMPLDAEFRNTMRGRRIAYQFIALCIMVTVGVASAPRYNYSIYEELRWSDALKNSAAKETALVTRQVEEIKRWKNKGDNGQKLLRFLKEELIPFYSDLSKTLETLSFLQGSKTEERRKALSNFVHLRIESYSHLERALAENNREEYKVFETLDREAAATIKSLKK